VPTATLCSTVLDIVLGTGDVFFLGYLSMRMVLFSFYMEETKVVG
jgi:hypothetical protein